MIKQLRSQFRLHLVRALMGAVFCNMGTSLVGMLTYAPFVSVSLLCLHHCLKSLRAESKQIRLGNLCERQKDKKILQHACKSYSDFHSFCSALKKNALWVRLLFRDSHYYSGNHFKSHSFMTWSFISVREVMDNDTRTWAHTGPHEMMIQPQSQDYSGTSTLWPNQEHIYHLTGAEKHFKLVKWMGASSVHSNTLLIIIHCL